MRRRPRIGVTGPDRGGEVSWALTWLGVLLAGGWAVRITPGHPRSLAGLDGLIIGGGADLDPALYGEDLADDVRRLRRLPIAWLFLPFFPLIYLARRLLSRGDLGPLDPGRDRLESALIDLALERGLPILGICRGSQLINVRLGGTLHQSLTQFYRETPQVESILPFKEVWLAPGSHLEGVMGISRGWVNALNHQAIASTGQGLRVAAREWRGVVQAIERVEPPLVIGVQWHPEYLPQLHSQRRIFRALVEASRGRRRARPA